MNTVLNARFVFRATYSESTIISARCWPFLFLLFCLLKVHISLLITPDNLSIKGNIKIFYRHVFFLSVIFSLSVYRFPA